MRAASVPIRLRPASADRAVGLAPGREVPLLPVCQSLSPPGLGLIVGGFIPSPLGAITEYAPTLYEIVITLGIWALGFLMITVFYKIALSVREGFSK